jgi:hypothetical protein
MKGETLTIVVQPAEAELTVTLCCSSAFVLAMSV